MGILLLPFSQTFTAAGAALGFSVVERYRGEARDEQRALVERVVREETANFAHAAKNTKS